MRLRVVCLTAILPSFVNRLTDAGLRSRLATTRFGGNRFGHMRPNSYAQFLPARRSRCFARQKLRASACAKEASVGGCSSTKAAANDGAGAT